MAALQLHRDGLFEGFDISVDPIGSQLGTMMEQQRKRNQGALRATGPRRERVHTNPEAGAQHLLDLQDCVKEDRATEKEGNITKPARLDDHAKDALRRSMETHTKRSRHSRSEQRSSGPNRRRSNGVDFDAKMAVVTDFARIAMEEFMERNARLERVKQMMHHATHPTLADHPGPKDAQVQVAVATDQRKMANVTTPKQVEAPEVSSQRCEMEPFVDI